MPVDTPRIGGIGAHPVLVIGILIFILPFFEPVIHIGIPGFVGWIGMGIILLGGWLSIQQNTQGY